MVIIPEQQINQRFVDLSDCINKVGKFGRNTVINLLNRFDVETANRAVVKHYPISSYCEGNATTEWTLEQLDSMATAMYLSFFQYAKQAILEKYGDMAFEELMSDRKLGKLLVCSPNIFGHHGKELNEFTMFAFSRYIDEYDRTELRSEVNFTIQLY